MISNETYNKIRARVHRKINL